MTNRFRGKLGTKLSYKIKKLRCVDRFGFLRIAEIVMVDAPKLKVQKDDTEGYLLCEAARQHIGDKENEWP